MPPEYYLGITVAAVILILSASLIRRKRTARQVLDKSSDTYQLVQQLSRIADALETLVVQLRASSPQVVQPPAPLQEPSEQRAPEPSRIEPARSTEPTKQHVVLSMFGR